MSKFYPQLQKNARALLTFLLLALSAPHSFALSFISPQFDPPILSGSNLVFSFGTLSERRTIACIDPADGSQRWRKTFTTNYVQAHFECQQKILLTIDGEIHLCDPQTGVTELKYKSACRSLSIHLLANGNFLLLGGFPQSGPIPISQLEFWVAVLNPKTWAVIWSVASPDFLNHTKDLVLLKESEEVILKDSFFRVDTDRVVARSIETGAVRWEFPPKPRYLTGLKSVIPIDNYLVLLDDQNIIALRESSGKFVKQITETNGIYLRISDGRLMLMCQNHDDVTYESLSVPGLRRKKATREQFKTWNASSTNGVQIVFRDGVACGVNPRTSKTLWTGGLYNWNGLFYHDTIYVSNIDFYWTRATIERLNIKSGVAKILYEQNVPKRR